MSVRDLQLALKAKGFDPGPIDGEWGDRTLAAALAMANGISSGNATLEPNWIAIARGYIGTREIPGAANNPTIVGWWKAIGSPWFKDDETPWCAGFVGGMLEQAGIKSTRNAAARSYELWGVGLDGPRFGCVVTFARLGGGHVGFCVGIDKLGRLMILGGNQGDAVNIKPFDRYRVTSYRWPAGRPIPEPGLPLLTSDGQSSTNEA